MRDQRADPSPLGATALGASSHLALLAKSPTSPSSRQITLPELSVGPLAAAPDAEVDWAQGLVPFDRFVCATCPVASRAPDPCALTGLSLPAHQIRPERVRGICRSRSFDPSVACHATDASSGSPIPPIAGVLSTPMRRIRVLDRTCRLPSDGSVPAAAGRVVRTPHDQTWDEFLGMTDGVARCRLTSNATAITGRGA